MNVKAPKGKYAKKTKVPYERSIMQIMKLTEKYGATGFGYAEDQSKFIVSFAMKERMVKIVLHPLPASADGKRQYFRALLLYIHAKLEAVEIGIQSFDSAFLSELMMTDGSSIGERIHPQIAGGQLPLLPAPKGQS